MTNTITSENIESTCYALVIQCILSLGTPSRSSEVPSSPKVKTTTDIVHIETGGPNITDGVPRTLKLGAENMGLGLQPQRFRAALKTD